MKKKIIFLDIDGVLATYKEWNSPIFWNKKINIPYSFNTECVNILNEILKITDADIVITSDWRLRHKKDLKKVFKLNGIIKSPIDYTEVITVSFDLLERNRATEINEYINRCGIEDYVILDDLYLNHFVDNNKFVYINDIYGLNEDGVKEKIINILK